MKKRWERIATLREKMRKQAEAVMHTRERSLADVELALDREPAAVDTPADVLQHDDAMRAVLVCRERVLMRELRQDKSVLRNASVAAKQADFLLEKDVERQRLRADKVDQATLEGWHTHQRGKP